jgi:hypothetical protein
VAGNGGAEPEFEVEKIRHHGRGDDSGSQLLVEGKSGEETLEPYKNVAYTKALDEYEASSWVGCRRICLILQRL